MITVISIIGGILLWQAMSFTIYLATSDEDTTCAVSMGVFYFIGNIVGNAIYRIRLWYINKHYTSCFIFYGEQASFHNQAGVFAVAKDCVDKFYTSYEESSTGYWMKPTGKPIRHLPDEQKIITKADLFYTHPDYDWKKEIAQKTKKV